MTISELLISLASKSLIIFDEIQKFPKAREAIKYLVADGRYDYIETGSLISIKENVESITIPSEERKMQMYPVNFEEFMVYMGEEILLDHIGECFEKSQPLDRQMHNKAMRLLMEYMLVGGMPQAIVAYKKNGRDFHAADVEKRDILALYEDDIKKAAGKFMEREQVAKPTSTNMDSTSGSINKTVRGVKKIGRNDPCPCGSGKKYKKCCGRDK